MSSSLAASLNHHMPTTKSKHTWQCTIYKQLNPSTRKLMLLSHWKLCLQCCSWSAVVRGAVAVGLEGTSSAVLHRKSRRHYGTEYCPRYEHSKHKSTDAFTDEHDGLMYARGQVSWLIAKGQDLHASEPTHATTRMLYSYWPGQSRTGISTLMACDEDHSSHDSKHKVSR
jgi:hypothetical protein